MKCYRKEDLKKIGYYRTEEQLQERLKEIECEAICVGEEKLSATCKRIKKEFPSMCLGVQLFFTGGDLADEKIALMKKVEITDGHSVKAPKDFISKGEYIVWRHDSSKEFNYEYFNYMTSEVFNEAYITESDVKDFVHKCALKVEKLFHVTKENVKFVVNFDGIVERAVLPDWIEKKVKKVELTSFRKGYEFKTSLFKISTFTQNKISLTFEECVGYLMSIKHEVCFGDYIVLLENGLLKILSEEQVENID